MRNRAPLVGASGASSSNLPSYGWLSFPQGMPPLLPISYIRLFPLPPRDPKWRVFLVLLPKFPRPASPSRVWDFSTFSRFNFRGLARQFAAHVCGVCWHLALPHSRPKAEEEWHFSSLPAFQFRPEEKKTLFVFPSLPACGAQK